MSFLFVYARRAVVLLSNVMPAMGPAVCAHAAAFSVWFPSPVSATSAAAAVASFILLVREGKGQLCDCVVQRFELRGNVVRLLLRDVADAGGQFVGLLFLGDGRRGDCGDVAT